MTLKQFIVLFIPPLLTLIFFLVKKPQTKKQKIYTAAKTNNWFVTADAVKWHYSSRTTNDPNDHSRAYVTYEYVIHGQKYKKRRVYNTDTNDFPLSVRVYYLENDPSKKVFENDIPDTNFDPIYTTVKRGCGWAFLIFIVWGILVFNVFKI